MLGAIQAFTPLGLLSILSGCGVCPGRSKRIAGSPPENGLRSRFVFGFYSVYLGLLAAVLGSAFESTFKMTGFNVWRSGRQSAYSIVSCAKLKRLAAGLLMSFL